MGSTSETSFFTNMVASRRGQTLVLALIILFMLVFLGGLFVTLIARNLARTRRSGQTMTAEYLAETGVRYASDQLAFSLDGADWRPVPEYPDVIRNIHGAGIANPAIPNLSDPDYMWLMQGYCRFTYGDGRFLIRVTYEPKYGDPISKYIKIESIGRIGLVDPKDPTTLDLKQPLRLRAERVAYKAIGITDYSRFITNQDRRTESFGLGVPAYTQPNGVKRAFTTQYGDSGFGGGSIRVNGNLTWYGKNFIWLDATHNESVEVAGDISHAVEWTGGGSGPTPESTSVYVNPNIMVTNWETDLLLRQSSDVDVNGNTLFDSAPVPRVTDPKPDVGVYRDGRPEGDVGYTDSTGVHHSRPRGIQRLDPPLLDVTGPTGSTGRYRELTRNSGEWSQSATNGTWYNTGFYGWGKGLYINNREDLQSESDLKTLRDDFMNPGGSQNWVGPYYNPPGVIMVFTPYDLNNADDDNDIMTGPDIILMESNTSGAKFNWYDEKGAIVTPGAGQMVMEYPENGIIFAEGNIRVKGMLGLRKLSDDTLVGQNVTVVSAGTIYVEGNLLKCGLDYRGIPLKPTDTKDSSIALLATDYVAINTTQFFGPAPESQTPGYWRPEIGGFGASVDNHLSFNFAFGIDPITGYSRGQASAPVCAYVRHAADGGSCYMNMNVNQFGAGANPNNAADLWYGLYKFDLEQWSNQIPPAAPAREYIYPLADIEAVSMLNTTPALTPMEQSALVAVQTYPIWEHTVFTIYPLVNPPRTQRYSLNVFPGASNQIGFRLDQNIAKADYLLSRFAVQPCDIRVEAMLYAQNASFYVISGEPFNPDPGDSRDEFLKGSNAESGRLARMGIEERWPFYGEPLDVMLIINGSVSENVSAPIADQAAWMSAWGWIPPVHGVGIKYPDDIVVRYRDPLDYAESVSLKDAAVDGNGLPVRQRGLSIIYDYMLSYPKVPNSTAPNNRAADMMIRVDQYYRPLAVTPKLPVSSQTIFFGRPT